MFNPIHGNFKNPKLWEAEGEIGKRDYQVKCGCRTLTTIKEIPLPKITTEEILKFTILCTLEIYKDKGFKVWADKWISGEDRSTNAAYAANAAATAYAAANAANAADAAAYAANAAADAADAAVRISNVDLVKCVLKAIS